MGGLMRIIEKHSAAPLVSLCRIGLAAAVVCAAFLSTGCRLARWSHWPEPAFARAQCSNACNCNGRSHVAYSVSYDSTDYVPVLAPVEWAYARAETQRKAGSACCVDSYFEAATAAWRYLQCSAEPNTCDGNLVRAWQLYHSSLARLIETGQRFGRLCPSSGLSLAKAEGTAVVPMGVPMAYHGFAWKPRDFSQLVLVGDYRVKDLSRKHRRDGVGVLLVVVRKRRYKERFHDDAHYFAATAVLRPAAVEAETSGHPSGMVLELHNPLQARRVAMDDKQFQLKSDTTAPLALMMQSRKRDVFEEFIQPGRSVDEAKLIMVEPYQPGKIPMIFVHGLLSDPLTWVDMANEIRAHPRLVDRYQIWAFKYPTGDPFLRSAATLRRELQAALDTVDPQRSDPAMSEIVMVGHSMGGLISKLQVTYSGDAVWRSVANRPLEMISASARQRGNLREMFFFEPQPSVKRVVFIGTPHKGSVWANRPIGRLGASLVRVGEDRKTDHDQLIRCNPGVFSPQIADRTPSSVDLLKPGNPILVSIQCLCVNSETKAHSIVGTGRRMLGEGPADGVVPVSSARCGGVQTESFVPTKHTELARDPAAIREITAILLRHLAEFDSSPASMASGSQDTLSSPDS